MNRLEQHLRHLQAQFGDLETIGFALLLFDEASSKSQRQKIIRTASLVLGVREKVLEKTFNGFNQTFDSMTLTDPDGQVIFQNGEYTGGEQS